MKRRNFVALAVALVAILALCACGGASTQGNGNSEPLPPLTEEETQAWLNGDTSFQGREATVAGKVFNTDQGDGVYVYQIYTDPKNFSGNTIVYYRGDNPQIGSDAFIRATGTIQENFEGENALGGTVTATCLEATSIEEVSYADAVSPALKTIEPGVTSEQNGYSITVNKIEFAADETRVYVTLVNNGAGRLTVYEHNAIILQDGRQYNVQQNYAANYPGISNELAIGATMEGIICFPKVEETGMQIQLQGHSDNWEADGSGLDFTFDIAV